MFGQLRQGHAATKRKEWDRKFVKENLRLCLIAANSGMEHDEEEGKDLLYPASRYMAQKCFRL